MTRQRLSWQRGREGGRDQGEGTHWVGVVCAIIGVGLFHRNRVAWYALLVYLGLGVLLPAVSVLDAKTVAVQGYAFPIAGGVLNGCIAVGLYFAVRPAFLQAARESDPSVEVPSVHSGAE